jgi:hypothetical protein
MADVEPADPYSGLDLGLADWLRGRTAEVGEIFRRSAEGAVRVGQILREVKERLGHGRFQAWVASALPFSYPTAVRMMQVAEQFGSGQSYQIDRFAPSAAYLLAQPSTPPEARQKALEMAQAGRSVTLAAARELVRPAGKGSGGEPAPSWRATPLREVGLRVVLAGACHMAGVGTAGQLQDRLDAGETLGLGGPDVADLRLALATLKGTPGAGPCPACGGTGRAGA